VQDDKIKLIPTILSGNTAIAPACIKADKYFVEKVI